MKEVKKNMLNTKYDHNLVENNKYKAWKEKGYFNCGDKTKPAYCIVIPPPNVTGKLHLGHAWDTALQDALIRYKRMDGFDTLWLPGMDHAAISTEAKVVNKLKSEGINKHNLGREGFLKEAWAWKDKYANDIRVQWAKLGLSLDYAKERFTLDEGLNKAVTKVFVDLYNKGLIYRGKRIINWDPEAQTALSNEEVIYKEEKGIFYHLKYYLEDKRTYLDVATTRPETLFGDTAVAVNPKDDRYKDLIGKKVILPIVNKLIPIIGDIHADPLFGTGVVKITPAHDPNDYEVGLRHQLEVVVVMNQDATMNEKALNYQGLTREKCREKLVNDLKDKDLLIRTEEIVHNVGYSERTNVLVEPYLSNQWFVKMDTLAEKVLDNQKDSHKKVNFYPKRFEKILNNWMKDCHDWCISRQLWWGHRIPAWYRNDEIYVGIEPPKEEGWIQDEDVLDTWFSSGLWAFSTLGWPNKTEDLERYFPNDCLITGYDIIFFWVCRMIFQSLEFTDVRPFKDCLIHGLIRDKDGRKMSKSLGNGIDPMDVIDTYGNDALRYFLLTNSAPGMDLRYDEEKVKSSWNFINKLWNASRFCLINIENFKEEEYSLENLKDIDKWVITRLNETIREVRQNMDKYEFNNAGSALYNFIWNDFCDNYIEMSKFSLNDKETKSTLYYIILNIIKLLHPFMPFVTEEIYQKLPFKEQPSIMIDKYPKYNHKEIYPAEKENVTKLIEFVTLFRNIKKENNILKEYKVKINKIYNQQLLTNILKLNDHLVEKELNIPKFKVNNSLCDIDIYYEKARTDEDLKNTIKQIEILQSNITRRKNLLSNVGYLNKAPKELITSERKKLEEEEQNLEILRKSTN